MNIISQPFYHLPGILHGSPKCQTYLEVEYFHPLLHSAFAFRESQSPAKCYNVHPLGFGTEHQCEPKKYQSGIEASAYVKQPHLSDSLKGSWALEMWRQNWHLLSPPSPKHIIGRSPVLTVLVVEFQRLKALILEFSFDVRACMHSYDINTGGIRFTPTTLDLIRLQVTTQLRQLRPIEKFELRLNTLNFDMTYSHNWPSNHRCAQSSLGQRFSR